MADGDEQERLQWLPNVSARVVRGYWQLVARVRVLGDGDAPKGPTKAMTRMSGIPAEEPRSKAIAAGWEWRDHMLCAQAVRVAREEWAGKGASALDEMARRLGIDEAELSRPFDEYARGYIALTARKAEGEGVRGVPGSRYDILRVRVLPNLADPRKPVGRLTSEDCAGLLKSLEAKGYAPATVAKAWILFKAIIRFAVNVHGLRPDPTYGLKPRKVRRVRVNYLEVSKADEVARTLATMRQTPAVCAARLALAAGVCAEESCGLRLMSCDPAQVSSIHISQVLSKLDGTWSVRPPKVDDRDRIIPMNEELRSILADRISELRAEAALAGRRVAPDTYLLDSPGRTRRGWTSPDRLRSAWKAIAESQGLVGVRGDLVTIHDLRHTFATCFLAKGGSMADLKAILGHATGFMTLEVYAASDPTIRARAMEETGRRLPGAPGPD